MYQKYADLKVLDEHYDAMKRYVDFLTVKQDPETGILDEGPLGDWLSPEGYKNDNSLLWTAYQVKNLEILCNTAKLLGKGDSVQYQQAYERRKAFFNQTYVDPATGKTINSGYAGRSLAAKPDGFTSKKGDFVDTQASYAIPLAFDVFNSTYQQKAQEHLTTTVTRQNQDNLSVMRPALSLMTGFIGTAAIPEALSAAGKPELAYQLLQQRSYPSWLYSVENGATTIWERLNSYTEEDGFGGNNSMNSFNHYSFGSIGAWMYERCLGIQPETPGFKTFLLRPYPDPTGQMTWAKGHYDSMYGKIESSWKVEGESMVYEFTVPANTSANLDLPVPEGDEVSESSGLTPAATQAGTVSYQLGSGRVG